MHRYLWWRITLSGWQQDYQRIAWHSVVSLLIAFYTLVIHQTVYSRRGLIYRILPIVTIATVFLVSFLFPGVRNRSWAGEFRIQAILLGFLLLLGAAVINRICPTLESKFADPKRGKSFRLSVGHLLLITVYGALVMAALRSVELRSSLVSLKSVLLLMSFYSGLSLAVYFVIHCRGLIWLKSVSVTAILAAIAVCWIYGEAWRNSIHFGTMLATTKHIALLGIATILFGLPILLRPMPESGSSTG